MERDGALLHPAGPEGEEDDDDGERGDDEETTDEEEESVDMEEYKHAMLELEGLKVSDTHADVQHEDKSEKGEEQKETETAPPARSDEDTEKDLEEELNEAEDECPELADLSTSNKEYKPFR